LQIIRNLVRLLSLHERRQVLLLVPLLAFTALVEVLGVASILPFMALVADPAVAHENRWLSHFYEMGGFADERSFLVAVGILMFLFIVGSNALTALNTWAVLRFSWMRNHTIAMRLLRDYLGKPYLFFLERHSADLGKNLLAEVQQAVAGTLVPSMRIAARGVAAVAVLAMLFFIEPLLALITATVLGGAYGLIFLAIRRRQRRLGQERLRANQNRFETLAEAFGGIKEVKLLGRERAVVRRFAGPSYRFAANTASNAVAAQLPRFALEAVAFGGIVLMVLYLLESGQDLGTIIPIVGLYTFAGYRLMPSLQQVFHGLTTIRFNAAALETLLADLSADSPGLPARGDGEPLPLRQEIRFRGVGFRFPTAARPLFQDLDLQIPAGSSVAFVGATGAGKSTAADLLLGLLQPDSGAVEVDGVALDDPETVRRWQRNLGYVPQSIFLADDTVARNIAFGLSDEEIDGEAVRRAARAAQIDDFIRREMPDGYDTLVGERGIRLSGGQRQRVGIARALYHDPQVLIFDEATSALDGVTEDRVLRAIQEIAEERTVIMIAHRLATVRKSDRIFLLAGGEVVAQGPYEELLSVSPEFRSLADPAVGEGRSEPPA